MKFYSNAKPKLYERIFEKYDVLSDDELRKRIATNRSEFSMLGAIGPTIALCGGFITLVLGSETEFSAKVVAGAYAALLLSVSVIAAFLAELYTMRVEVAKQILEQRQILQNRPRHKLLLRVISAAVNTSRTS